jgi:hypothetical protein
MSYPQSKYIPPPKQYKQPTYEPRVLAKIQPIDNDSINKFFKGISTNDINQVRSELDKNPRFINMSYTIDEKADTKRLEYPLHTLMQSDILDKTNMLRFLIEQKAYVNCKNEYNVTPLHIATLKQDSDAMRILIENKADVNLRDLNERTPLEYALSISNEIDCSKDDSPKKLVEMKNEIIESDYIKKLKEKLVGKISNEMERSDIKDFIGKTEEIFNKELTEFSDRIANPFIDALKKSKNNKEIDGLKIVVELKKQLLSKMEEIYKPDDITFESELDISKNIGKIEEENNRKLKKNTKELNDSLNSINTKMINIESDLSEIVSEFDKFLYVYNIIESFYHTPVTANTDFGKEYSDLQNNIKEFLKGDEIKIDLFNGNYYENTLQNKNFNNMLEVNPPYLLKNPRKFARVRNKTTDIYLKFTSTLNIKFDTISDNNINTIYNFIIKTIKNIIKTVMEIILILKSTEEAINILNDIQNKVNNLFTQFKNIHPNAHLLKNMEHYVGEVIRRYKNIIKDYTTLYELCQESIKKLNQFIESINKKNEIEYIKYKVGEKSDYNGLNIKLEKIKEIINLDEMKNEFNNFDFSSESRKDKINEYIPKIDGNYKPKIKGPTDSDPTDKKIGEYIKIDLFSIIGDGVKKYIELEKIRYINENISN